MIIPLSAFSTDRMTLLMKLLKTSSSKLEIANFSWRPGKLFDGVNLQLSIFFQTIGRDLEVPYSTRYILWDSEARSELFSGIQFGEVDDKRLDGSIPKLGHKFANSIMSKLRSQKIEMSNCFTRDSENKVFYRRGGLYWKVFIDFETDSSEEKILTLQPSVDKYSIIAALSSSLWWWYYTSTSDCRHLGNRDIDTFPFDPRLLSQELHDKLSALGKTYVKSLLDNSEKVVRVYKGTKPVSVISFRVNQSKPIIDQIDQVLAKHYGFTDEELDFIINYDIKYRMGQAATEDEE